jgi:hypothetical protein
LFTLQAVPTTLVQEYFERKNNETNPHIRNVGTRAWDSAQY